MYTGFIGECKHRSTPVCQLIVHANTARASSSSTYPSKPVWPPRAQRQHSTKNWPTSSKPARFTRTSLQNWIISTLAKLLILHLCIPCRFRVAVKLSIPLINNRGGSHVGESWRRTGYCGLGRAVESLGLRTSKPVNIDYVVSNDHFTVILARKG